jgi:MoaA/NifB/PqqE/SkfB family radical SAM enzyme
MNTEFDRLTEGERERDLMQRVRSGAITAATLERACLPFPVKLQVQTVSPCNAACVMCPWPQTKDQLPQGVMAEAVFHRIVEQIQGRGVERVGLFLMNEPTLDRRLERLTAHLKKREPKTTALIFTNGLLLDGARAQALADAGMDEIDISVIGFDAESHGRIMKGVDFATVMRNLEQVADRLRDGRLGRLVLKLICLDFPGMRAAAAAFEQRSGLKVHVKPVTNRAGLIDLSELGVDNPTSGRMVACQRPFVKAYVLYNGDMVLCNCDWMRTTILGNVMQQSLETMWRGSQLMAIRRHHLSGRLPAGSICAQCDYPYLP